MRGKGLKVSGLRITLKRSNPQPSGLLSNGQKQTNEQTNTKTTGL